jgi:hypothetical protein
MSQPQTFDTSTSITGDRLLRRSRKAFTLATLALAGLAMYYWRRIWRRDA